MNWIENFVKKSYAYLQIEKQLKGKKQGHTPNKAYLTEAQRIGPETTTRIQDVRSMCQASGFKLDSCLAVTNKVSYEGFWVVFFFSQVKVSLCNSLTLSWNLLYRPGRFLLPPECLGYQCWPQLPGQMQVLHRCNSSAFFYLNTKRCNCDSIC